MIYDITEDTQLPESRRLEWKAFLDKCPPEDEYQPMGRAPHNHKRVDFHIQGNRDLHLDETPEEMSQWICIAGPDYGRHIYRDLLMEFKSYKPSKQPHKAPLVAH